MASSAAPTKASRLLAPLRLGELSLKNRVVMAPLTRCRATPESVPTPMMLPYYAARGRSAGLVITEASIISKQARGFPCTAGIFNDEQVQAWRPIVNAVKAGGAAFVCQLWHQGRTASAGLSGEEVVGPSAIAFKDSFDPSKTHPAPRALLESEIPGIIAQYVHATQCAKAAGFDGVEVHAANGYLLDQFLHDGSNTRTDGYGGSIENRCRLLREVVTACEAVFPGRIGVRLSPPGHFGDVHDSTPTATFTHAVQMLSKLRPLYIHLVEPRDWGLGESVGEDLTLTSALFRKHFDGPILSCGGHDLTTGEACLAAGDADAIVYGRHFISNPDLVERFRDGIALTPYDRATFYGGGATGYNTYTRADGSPEWE